MSPDILTNRILRTTVLDLVGDKTLNRGLRMKLRASAALLSGVRTVPLTARVFKQVQLHSNNRLYRVLMVVCRWLFEARIAEDRPGEHRFRDVLRNEERMRRIFERFVRNFYVRHPGTAIYIGAEHMEWEAAAGEGSELSFLPGMITDVTIRYPGRTVVEYVLHGHRVRVLTLDLNVSPNEIETQMIGLSDLFSKTCMIFRNNTD